MELHTIGMCKESFGAARVAWFLALRKTISFLCLYAEIKVRPHGGASLLSGSFAGEQFTSLAHARSELVSSQSS